MQEIFEKIKERLMEKSVGITFPLYPDHADPFIPTDEAMDVVNQVAEEYVGKTDTFGNSEQVNKGWIPCSERLPELYTPVFITYRRTTDGYTKVVIARMQADCDWRIEFGGGCDCKSVIAWQPLPEPYKGE